MADERNPISPEPTDQVPPAEALRQGDVTGVRRTVRCKPPAGFSGPSSTPDDPVDSARLLAQTSPRSRFDDGGEIARGGMGQVRRAFDKVLLREVAMKVIDPSASEQPGLALRFIEEAQITGQLDHPNIVPVYDLGVDSGSCAFFTMKLVQGRTLGDLIGDLHNAGSTRPDVEPVLQVLMKVCDAVAFAHSRGVIHRDLKPDNIMVGTHGQVYVMDWGVAHLVDAERPSVGLEPLSRVTVSQSQDGPGSIVGTVDFMAPEQALGKIAEIDERTDVFGLGGILYFLLTGHGPNAVASPYETLANATHGRVPRPQDRGAWPDLPPGLCAITMKALSASPDDRHASVSGLKAELEQFLRGGGWFASAVFQPSVAIVRQGDIADCAYIIVEGRCQVQKRSADVQTVLRELGPGDVFGETAVLTRGTRTATIVALDAVTVKIVTREALEAELEKNPWVGSFMKALASRFREIDDLLSRLSEPTTR